MKVAVLWMLKSHPGVLRRIIVALLRLDNQIYDWLGTLSKMLEAGPHPKHDLTRYHDFFLNQLSPGDRVLDVGCGKGELLVDMAHKTRARAVGIELNAQNAKLAKEAAVASGQQVNVIHADIWHTTLNETFDVVTLSNVLEHLTQRPALLKHIAEVFQPKRLLIRVPMFDRDWLVAYKKHMGVECRLDTTHEIEYTLELFQREVQQAGLEISQHYVQWGELYAVLTQVRH
jgi:cyclopropane fatty-acyl-phospholipid synthase-like methyltransferase